jgi:hypothetical protein
MQPPNFVVRIRAFLDFKKSGVVCHPCD